MATAVVRERNVAPADESRQSLLRNVYARVSVLFAKDADFKRDNPHASLDSYETCRILNDARRGELAEVPLRGVTSIVSLQTLVDRVRGVHPEADARFQMSSSERGGSSKLILSVPLEAGVPPANPARDAVDSSFQRFFTEKSVLAQVAGALIFLLALLVVAVALSDPEARRGLERQALRAWSVLSRAGAPL